MEKKDTPEFKSVEEAEEKLRGLIKEGQQAI